MYDRVSNIRDHQQGLGIAEYTAMGLRASGRPFPQKVSAKVILQARVDHSRWIVDCPDPNCRGATMADIDDPRFYCFSCHNKAVGGDWLPVQFPAEREAIEKMLMERPAEGVRNWRPGETVADLVRENKDHALEMVR